MSEWIDVPLKETDVARVLMNVESIRVLLDYENRVFVCDVNDPEGINYEVDMSYADIMQLIIQPVTIAVGPKAKEKLKPV